MQLQYSDAPYLHSDFSRRSLIFQSRAVEFENLCDDCQLDITDGLSCLGAIEIGDDPDQIEVRKAFAITQAIFNLDSSNLLYFL